MKFAKFIILLAILLLGYYTVKPLIAPQVEEQPQEDCKEEITRHPAEKKEQPVMPRKTKAPQTDTKHQETDDSEEMAKSTHLRFKGVPIDGSLNKFVRRMKRAGFKGSPMQELFEGDQVAILTGDFASFKDCKLHVATLTGQDLVAKIDVLFPAQEQWRYLYGDYKTLKELLTTKYGQPSSCREVFNTHAYERLDDGTKMYKIGFDEYTFKTVYTTKEGTITLSIEHDSVMSAFVCLTYQDKQNGQSVRAKAINDL